MKKKYLLHIKNTFRRNRIRMVLVLLKPYFVSESDILRHSIEAYSLYYGLYLHPSILFNDHSYSFFAPIDLLVPLLAKRLVSLISEGPFFAEKDKKMLKSMGVNECFVSNINNIIAPSVFPFKSYNTPNVNLKPNVVVYSVITGGYDCVHELLHKQLGVEYYLFTNNKKITSSTWTIVYVESELDNLLLSRKIKMLPHEFLPTKFDISIYVDANADIYGDIGYLANFLNDETAMAVTKHSCRTKIIDEIYACYYCGKIKDVNQALDQYNTYLSQGFSDDMGLAECTILIRKHKNIDVINLMNSWWYEFRSGVKRDQVSLLPCVYLMSFQGLKLLDGCVWYNQYICISSGHSGL